MKNFAIALLSIGLPYSQHRLRVGAAMLGAEGNSAIRIARLATQERCVTVVRHIALCGAQVEPANVFWKELLDALPQPSMPKEDVLPHLTRFVAMNGFTRRGKETVMQWIRPSPRAVA